MAKKKKHNKKVFTKIIVFSLIIIILILASIAYSYYNKIYKENVRIDLKDEFVYIPTGSTYDDVVRILTKEQILNDIASFEWLAEIKKYNQNVKPGRYRIKKGMNNNELINLLRSGKQEPVRLTIRGFRNYRVLAGYISHKLEADSVSICDVFEDEMLAQKYGFNEQNFLCIIIPNTYEFFWNTSATEFIERMAKEYKTFWNNERKNKAQNIGLSQTEVAILASIIQLETNKTDEMPDIAGVYINRLKKDMRLQADPTVIFAVGDFSIRRVKQEHLEYDSPYNTYKYSGLPPGPISIAYTHSIDAVLNYKMHNFLYFCARDDFSGYHVFAKTLEEHLNNARKYQRELNKKKIF
ncbi:MAG TPA: endolytic transglycosylase MltG [Bacteroidales bacterium]|nr:endolytic transglycosylase MltG [Bacteroidales bacterium]